MYLSVTADSNVGHSRVQGRCPHCRNEVVFEHLGQYDVGVGGPKKCGQRKCPNPDCNGHLFVVLEGDKLEVSYPAMQIDFDSSNVPPPIVATFEEAIVCFANDCFRASAIMVRRTLEEICEEKSCAGDNLKKRLKDLSTKIVIPNDLLDAMTELRLLGNDAAHIEAKDYNNVSEPEVELAIELTKEIMKALYQYSDLLSRLKAQKALKE